MEARTLFQYFIYSTHRLLVFSVIYIIGVLLEEVMSRKQFLRRWLPELAAAPLALLHEPWKDEALLKRSGYPAPMVDLGQSRQRALDAYAALAR